MCSASTKLIATCCVLAQLLISHSPAHNVVAKVLQKNVLLQMPGLTTTKDDQHMCTSFNLNQILTDNGSNAKVARIKEFTGKSLRKLHFRVPDKIETYVICSPKETHLG